MFEKFVTDNIVFVGLGSVIQYVRKIFQKVKIYYPLIYTRTCAF